MIENRKPLGETIALFRKRRGISQEELAGRLGVTCQAVSKWECGGTPDTLLVPLIADTFGVTIQALYYGLEERGSGRKKEIFTKDICKETLSRDLWNTEPAKRLERAFELLSIILTAVDVDYGKEAPFVQNTDISMKELSSAFYYCLGEKSVVAYARFLEEGNYFCWMMQEDNEFASMLDDEEKYIQLFQILSQKENLRLLFFLNSHLHVKYTLEALSEALALPEEKVRNAIKELKQCFWIEETQVETRKGIEKVFGIEENIALLPFLYSVYDLINGMRVFLYRNDKRSDKLQLPLL